MIDAAVEAEREWQAVDWQALGTRAVLAAVAQSHAPELETCAASIEVAIRLTSDDEVHGLNRDYRGKDAPTNVLSFPMCTPDEVADLAASPMPEILLGDIVLAHGVCAREAAEKRVPLADHAAHLIVHGMLHLLGYDHGDDDTANDMESREARAMAALGLHDPYCSNWV
jgi:probable rRNA maturation factor